MLVFEAVVVVSMEEEEVEAKGEGLTSSLGAARAASRAASLAASFFSYKGSTRSLLMALSRFSLFDLNDFAMLKLYFGLLGSPSCSGFFSFAIGGARVL